MKRYPEIKFNIPIHIYTNTYTHTLVILDLHLSSVSISVAEDHDEQIQPIQRRMDQAGQSVNGSQGAFTIGNSEKPITCILQYILYHKISVGPTLYRRVKYTGRGESAVLHHKEEFRA